MVDTLEDLELALGRANHRLTQLGRCVERDGI